jgi:stage II sporulation protein P
VYGSQNIDNSKKESDIKSYMDYWQNCVRETCLTEEWADNELTDEVKEGEDKASDEVGNTSTTNGKDTATSDGENTAGSDTNSENVSDGKNTAAGNGEKQVTNTGEYTTSNVEKAKNSDTGNKVATDKKTVSTASTTVTKSTASDTVTVLAQMSDIESSYKDMDFESLVSYCYIVKGANSITSSELNAKTLLEKDLSIDKTTDGYDILIYHTHASETFADSKAGERADTIVGVGDYLVQLLEERGFSVYHDDTIYDMKSGVLDRSGAYDYARIGISDILEKNPEIKVAIDLHRDGVAETTRLVTEIDGVKMAQLMLFNGVSRDDDGDEIDYLKNENKISNLAFSLQMYLAGRANYGSLMRKIYIGNYRYNMDLLERSLLVEAGGQTNTVQEVKNSMVPLANLLTKLLTK